MKQKLREWGMRLWGTFKSRDAEIEEELRFHLDMAEQDALRQGDSDRGVHLQQGGLTQASDSVRDQQAFPWLSDFFRDTRHGVRLLGRSPLFAVATIGSLALGIGANTAIYSLFYTIMLRQLPVAWWSFCSAVTPARSATMAIGNGTGTSTSVITITFSRR